VARRRPVQLVPSLSLVPPWLFEGPAEMPSHCPLNATNRLLVSIHCMVVLMSSRSFFMFLRVVKSSLSLPLKGEWRWESGVEEEEPRRGGECETEGEGRGGGGVVERRDIEGARGEVAHNQSNFP
jgi:hypothetical protein